MKKDLYSIFDGYLQRKLYCYAYSIAQATVLLRNQALKINGKFKFTDKPKKEIKSGV